MLRTYTFLLGALAAVGATIGCGATAPTQPTSPTPNPATTSAPATLSGTLSITAFTVSGWYDGQFHYVPALTVAAGAAGSAVEVQEVSFERSDSGVGPGLPKLRFLKPVRVPAGGTLDLPSGSPLDLVSQSAIGTMTVRVSFLDESGRSGMTTADIAVPPISQVLPDVTLAIKAFSVTGWFENGRFHYWPRLTVAETSGRGPAAIVEITFELLDVGPAGRVPPTYQRFVVAAGGTLTLDEDGYDGPWLEIDSERADASRISVVISYVDDAGRGRSVTALAPVSK